MAKLYITEFAALAVESGRLLPAPMEPSLASQTVTIAGASAQSSAFNAATTVVELHTDAICSVLFGADPTAVATGRRMAAGETRYYAVPRGQSFKVATITNT